ncbi:MAG: DUF4369 domain-containing protein [Prevotella sp.]|nr:DUF4369 domain-containing protein [Prevotella sp.]
MKKLLFLFLPVVLFFISCGADSEHFKIEGRILNMNQGEFYVYSLDGAISGFDTIKVMGGRFAYEMPCSSPTTLMIVFPNFSQHPIFAAPGKTAEINANASHLKEMEVEGSKDNELMTRFRELTAKMTPPEVAKQAGLFAADNAESPVAIYLIRTYFVDGPHKNLHEAERLTKVVADKQKESGQVKQLEQQIRLLSATMEGAKTPRFSAEDINGHLVTADDLGNDIAVICTCASWNFESLNVLRELKRLQRKAGGRLKVVSIAIDGNQKQLTESLKRDSISWPVICDGRMFESPVLSQTGLGTLPDNVLIHRGKVIAHGLPLEQLKERITKMIE